MGLRNSGGRGRGSSVRPGSVAPAGPPRPGEVAPVPRAPRPSASLPKTRRAGWCVAAAPGCKGRRRPRLCPLRTHPLPSWLHRAAPPARRAPRTRARARRPRPLSCARAGVVPRCRQGALVRSRRSSRERVLRERALRSGVSGPGALLASGMTSAKWHRLGVHRKVQTRPRRRVPSKL